MNAIERMLYLEEPEKRGGRRKLLTDFGKHYLLNMLKERRYTCITTLAKEFAEEYCNDEDAPIQPSLRTCYREIKMAGLTKKVIERRHILLDHNLRYEYMERIAFIDPREIIDVDETASSPSQFLAKYGWAESGEKAKRMQFKIGSKHYSVVAAYTYCGFLCWEIIEGSFNSKKFMEFLNLRLSPYLNNHCVLLDNASIHKTMGSLTTLNDITNGRYEFSPPFSPDLKPIEKAFALVKRWLREREEQVIADPIGFINLAFEHFSVNSPDGQRG